MAAPRLVEEEGFYCRYKGKYSQGHLEESRTGGESIRLNLANRLNRTRRGEKGEENEREREEDKRQETMWLNQQLNGNEKLGKAPLSWRSLGAGWEELRRAASSYYAESLTYIICPPFLLDLTAPSSPVTLLF